MMDIAGNQRESQRLDALRKLNVLDTAPNDAFDRITRMAAQLFNLPVAAVSLTDVDRQWFKSKVGVDHTVIAREEAPCSRVTESMRLLVIPDLLASREFRNGVLANSGVRFYAGAPLITSEGFCIGAMYVLGNEPRQVTEQETQLLRDMAAMVMVQIELKYSIGRIDSISGMPNQRRFKEDVDELARADAPGSQRLAVLVNLATLTQIDAAVRVLGSSYLDALLKDAALWLRECAGATTMLYHVGTAQFAFIAPQGADTTGFTAKVYGWLARRSMSRAAPYITTATFGVAGFAVGGADGLDLLRRCHNAAHDAESAEQGVGLYSAQQDATYQRRFTLLNAFGSALASPDQLSLVFQPRVDMLTGRWRGAEALLRWNHPTLGFVSPAEFIPIVEKTSLARAATEWVLETAMLQLAAWRAEGIEVQLSVNVSATNLVEQDFASGVLARLERHGLPPQLLEIELTESAVMTNPVQAEQAFGALHAAGIVLAIDDFGTGYSSLSYLQKLPADVVKIDRSFILELGSVRGKALVQAMIGLLHGLGYWVVAEGIETEAIADVLREMGCNEAQGYLYAKPLAPDVFGRGWLAQLPSLGT